MTKEIIILGGGISGLSSAYNLIDKGFNVTIIEKNNNYGGQSRSIEHGRCSIEYAWRVWTSYYDNFLNICRNIKIDDKRSIFDNFVSCCDSNQYKRVSKKGFGRGFGDNSILNMNRWEDKKEYYNLVSKLIGMILMSDEHLQKDDMTFMEYIDSDYGPTLDFCYEMVGPVIGVEATKATLFSVSKGWQTTYFESEIFSKNRKIYVTNAPYNDAIFKHWVIYLEKKGVKLLNNTTIKRINYNKDINKITSVDTDKDTFKGDEFIVCLDQTAISKLITGNLEDIPSLERVKELPELGNQYYFGMLFFLNDDLDATFDSGCCNEQPWKPVIQRYNSVWDEKWIKRCKSKEIWQLSVLNLVKGYNGKVLQDCSVKEILEEIFLQMRRSELIKGFRTKSGKTFWDIVEHWEIWPFWDDKNGKLYNTIDEYKLSINKGCRERMPEFKSEISNMYFGSVIAKNDMPMISQEIACSNGLIASNLICEKYKKPLMKVKDHKGTASIAFYPIRFIDKCLFKMGLDINPLYILVALIIIIIYIVRKKIK